MMNSIGIFINSIIERRALYGFCASQGITSTREFTAEPKNGNGHYRQGIATVIANLAIGCLKFAQNPQILDNERDRMAMA